LKRIASTSRSHAQRGAALVEFCLILPFLLLLTLGVVEVSRYALFSLFVANAARAGAIYGTENSTTFGNGAGIVDAVQQDGSNGIVTAPLTVATSTPSACWSNTSSTTAAPPCSSGYHFVQYLTVTASGTISPLFADQLSTRTISATVTMRLCQLC
jgi:Flp pilus assembly protein TadG